MAGIQTEYLSLQVIVACLATQFFANLLRVAGVMLSSSCTTAASVVSAWLHTTSHGASSASNTYDGAVTAGGAVPAPPQWDEAMYLDTLRDPRAMDWCLDYGYERGNACVLYKVVRNTLKYRSQGRVPTMADVAFAMTCAVLLLLRTAQDVVCAHHDMAKAGLPFVYTAIRDKMWMWVQQWPVDVLPAVDTVVNDVEEWAAAVPAAELPLPVWVTAFSTSTFGNTFTWGQPSTHDIHAFQRCAGVPTTRSSVTPVFVAFMRHAGTWQRVFTTSLASAAGTSVALE